MRPILLVEDSTLFGKLVKREIEASLQIPVVWAKTMADAETALLTAKNGFEMAVLDLNLPDAPHGEIIAKVLDRGISSFVFTADVTKELREMVWSQQVADYIIKDDPSSLEYLVAAMQQMQKNNEILVLIVDSSGTSRYSVSELLYVRKYRVINAVSGAAALGILEQHPETSLVLCEEALSDMDGSMLCRKIRENYKRDHLAIIGMITRGKTDAGVRFLKSGANDVIVAAPLLVEEFYAKLQNCLENVQLLKEISRASTTDATTGLANRQQIFSVGPDLLLSSGKRGFYTACIVVHINDLGLVNNEYGYGVGDRLLRRVAFLFRDLVGVEPLVGRSGGATFTLLLSVQSSEQAVEYAEKIKEYFKTESFHEPDSEMWVKMSISVGEAVTGPAASITFEELMLTAEQFLSL